MSTHESGLMRVLDELFYLVGGKRLTGTIKSTQFRDRFTARERFFERKGLDTDAGLVARAHPLSAQTTLGQISLAERTALAHLREVTPRLHFGDLERDTANVLLRHLGELTVTEAGRYVPRGARALVREFASAGAKRQLEICYQLYHLFRPERDEHDGPEQSLLEHTWADLRDQPLSRILPAEYGARGGRPNCLANGQMLLSLFREQGIQTIGFYPVHSQVYIGLPLLSRFGAVMAGHAAEHGIELRPSLAHRLLSASADAASVPSLPDSFHLGLIVPLRDGSWCMLDPHGGCVGKMDSPLWALNTHIWPRIKRYAYACPGLTFQSNDPVTPKKVVRDAIVGRAGYLLELAADIQECARGRGGAALFPLFVKSPALDEIAKARFRGQALEEITAVLNGEAVVEFKIALSGRTPEQQRFFAEERSRISAAVLVLDALLEGQLRPIFEGRSDGRNVLALLGEGVRRALSTLHAMAFNTVRRCMVLGDHEHMLHATIECFEPVFRIGVEMCWYYLAVEGRSLGNSFKAAVESLGTVCGG